MAAQNKDNTVIASDPSLRGTKQSAPLTPKLRFKEFEGEWDYSKLENIVAKKISYGIVQAGEHVDGGMPYIKSKDVNGPIKIEELERTSDEIAKKYVRSEVRPGDIVFSLRGNIGISQILPESIKVANLTQGTARISVSNNYANYFVYCSLHTLPVIKRILCVSKGSTFQEISLADLRNVKIVSPTLPEQKKIAAFLSAVDKIIQQLSKKKALLEQYKKGVMQQLFSQKIRFSPTLDDYNDNLAQGKMIDLAANYQDWEEKRLGDLTYKVGKKNKENIQYPIYSINNQEGFRPQSEQFDGLDSNDRGYDISLYKIVESETFAYNPARINVGSIGYSYDLNKVIVSSLYVSFKTKDKLEDLYLLAYLDTYTFHKDILRYEEGGVRQYLFYENFSHIKIPLPSNEEQKKIAKFLSTIDTKIESVKQKITQTQTFKKGLLQQMFV